MNFGHINLGSNLKKNLRLDQKWSNLDQNFWATQTFPVHSKLKIKNGKNNPMTHSDSGCTCICGVAPTTAPGSTTTASSETTTLSLKGKSIQLKESIPRYEKYALKCMKMPKYSLKTTYFFHSGLKGEEIFVFQLNKP